MADFRGAEGAQSEGVRGLANRWFQPLTHVSGGSFPRDSATLRQRGKRETRDSQRFAVAQCAAQSVPQTFVYFIQAGDRGPIKIGIAQNPKLRRSQLQTAHFEQLHLLHFFPGDVDMEERLHRRFAADHLRGEWFKPSMPLLGMARSKAVSSNYVLMVACAFVGTKGPLPEIDPFPEDASAPHYECGNTALFEAVTPLEGPVSTIVERKIWGVCDTRAIPEARA